MVHQIQYSKVFCYCRTQADQLAKHCGCKGSHALMKLLHHSYIDQTVPDAMHTVKDVTEHLLKLITGGEDSQKVCASELALSRSFEVVPSPRSSAPATQ